MKINHRKPINIIGIDWFLQSMKIDTHNPGPFNCINSFDFLIHFQYHSIQCYYRLQSILSIVEFHRLGTPGSMLSFASIVWYYTGDCLPVQYRPFPVYPVLQKQLYEPGSFTQLALEWQLSVPILHSSMSVHSHPLPSYPSKHLHLNAPMLFVQDA